MGRRLAVVAGLVSLAGFLGSPANAVSPRPVEGIHGMVVSAQRLASEVGVHILREGGNAIDAAVAVGYAEAVVNPCCGNLGGGGFMVIHLADGSERFIDFRETAPGAATAGMYLDPHGNVVPGESLRGYKAVGVPGTVMGLDTALRRYGRLTRGQVMAPAIRLAREGFVLTRPDTAILDTATAAFHRQPDIAKIFLRPDGTALRPGDRLVQTDLANTLQSIAHEGSKAFYTGRIPHAIAAASTAGDGILSVADFTHYRVSIGAPLTCTYRGYTIVSTPPPSSGGTTMCEILNVLSGYDMKALGFHSAASIHLMAEAMRHAYFDRNADLGDPAFVKNPLARLLSQHHAATIRAAILPDRATPSASLAPAASPQERHQTTQISVIDGQGNAVSMTYTLNGYFGAIEMAPKTGVLLNDEMDDFTSKPGVPNMYGLVQGSANAIAPGKRPLSSMAPTLVTRNGHVFLVLGSPGGSRIITITLEALMNVIDYGMGPQEAADAPRFHEQGLPDLIDVERFAVSPDTAKLLRGMGYTLKRETPWGALELVEVGPPRDATSAPSSGNDSERGRALRPGRFYGANDDRRPGGAAIGY
ncbi:gamma-glutamyltransferase [Acidiphilium acidophilum]|uniref:gamma-glutamyltransferase n=1 Tax=Acidiphilium acidophilum TaxID=76588 RepID=UPI002E8E7864|nr:gamma-glutamyltransferase [Acidiphilium acidophilum]